MPDPTTIEDLADLDRGLILILGGRRSGKTMACEAILRRWGESGASYRHFGYLPGRRPRFGGTPSSGNLGGRCRGYRRILVDEPDDRQRPDEVSSDVLVLATSNPQTWMTQQASWIVWVANPAIEPNQPALRIERGRPPPPPPPMANAPTIWERLLAGVGLEA